MAKSRFLYVSVFVALVCAAAGAATINGRLLGRADAAQADSSYPAANMAAFGITFNPLPSTTGAAVTLPGGGSGITDQQAIGVAMDHTGAVVNGQVPSGVQMTTTYGIFSDSHVGKLASDGQVQPAYTNVPVWLVTFTGPGVDIQPAGPIPAGETAQSLAHHEESVVVDASTGGFLITYS